MSVLTTATKAAKATGFPYATLLALVRDGVIPCVRIPGKVFPLIDMKDLETFINASKTGSGYGTNPFLGRSESHETTGQANTPESGEKTVVGRSQVHWTKEFEPEK